MVMKKYKKVFGLKSFWIDFSGVFGNSFFCGMF